MLHLGSEWRRAGLVVRRAWTSEHLRTAIGTDAGWLDGWSRVVVEVHSLGRDETKACRARTIQSAESSGVRANHLCKMIGWCRQELPAPGGPRLGWGGTVGLPGSLGWYKGEGRRKGNLDKLSHRTTRRRPDRPGVLTQGACLCSVVSLCHCTKRAVRPSRQGRGARSVETSRGRA